MGGVEDIDGDDEGGLSIAEEVDVSIEITLSEGASVIELDAVDVGSGMLFNIEELETVTVDEDVEPFVSLEVEINSSVVEVFPVEKLVPFASLMVGYISVALTHLTRAVRQDTLRLLDSLLTIPAASSLFVTDAVKLLRDLLTLLSPSGKGTRLESSTLEADETNLVWYRTVLQPILRILQSITSQQKTETFLAEKKSVTFVLGESLFVDLTSAKSRSLLERETAILSAKRGDPGQKDSKQDISLVRDLSSVLDVIWTEAMNSLTSDTAKYKADAGVLVTLVVEVCVALSSPVGLLSDLPSKDQELLLSTCVCPLLSHIGQSFPLPEECFSSVFSQSKAKQKQKPTANNTAVRFNFGFCHLYAQLSAHAPRDVSAQVLRFIQAAVPPHLLPPEGVLVSSDFGRQKKLRQRRREGSTGHLEEADVLFKAGKYEEAFDLLQARRDLDDPDVLWRLARVLFLRSKDNVVEGGESEKQAIFEALALCHRAYMLDSDSVAVHKWMSILLNAKAKYLGPVQRIENVSRIRCHLTEATRLDPDNGMLWHLLGQWYLSVASISEYQRVAAALLLGEVPSATVQDALECFIRAEIVEPMFYAQNLLLIAECYLKLGDYESAKHYLEEVKRFPETSPEDARTIWRAKNLCRKHFEPLYSTEDDLSAVFREKYTL
ncbi:unnamed protein product [Cyprideis torosa]|uniref:Regulator of microtubule dynamics protein 1 n=1 Tax=Cyprideis torosa TaxID=163714 RepID=A0A7R8W341_9CRUS|nr:unnamed protein product [Cyprideis torosa]CAG0881747.1 unnamed protein product [Cyprideis torosa]